jgi:GT2 family glycosyltransferase
VLVTAAAATPHVSVVVVTYRRPGLLAVQLNSLAEQDYPNAFEVVVADNAGDGVVERLVDSFRAGIDIRLVDASGRSGSAAARNLGSAACRSDRILFLDDDDEADPGFIRHMADALEKHPFVAGALDHERLNHNWVARALRPWQTDRLMDGWGFLPHASGCAIGIRRELLDAVGGWPENISHSDDVAFCWAVGLTGARLKLVSEAVIHYRHRSSAWSYLKQEWASGVGDLQLHQQFGGEGMPFPRPGWGYSKKGFVADLAHVRSPGDLLVWVGTGLRVLGRLQAALRMPADQRC